MSSDRPALLGGRPRFDPPLHFARPTVESPDEILVKMRPVVESGRLTDGPLTRELEERTQSLFQVEHCVAVSSCTVGLMLLIQALEPPGAVLLPSFTFAATAHAVAWNSLPLLFADCSPQTWCLQPDDIRGDPGLVLAVHISGVPCDVVGLEKATRDLGVDLIFDAAHGAGSTTEIDGVAGPLGGFGRAEVFSLTPTKVLSGAEGGLITTNDGELAERLRIARNYGNPGDYDSRFPGLNARLSEFHAAVALASMDHLDERVEARNTVAQAYREGLGAIPGIGFQQVSPGSVSSYKDFTVLVDEAVFGCSRDDLALALEAEGIETRKYYSPPVHRQAAYADAFSPDLPVTDRLASQVLSLPMWSHLVMDSVEQITSAVVEIHIHASEVASLLR